MIAIWRKFLVGPRKFVKKIMEELNMLSSVHLAAVTYFVHMSVLKKVND